MARAVEGEEPGNARLRGAQKRGKEELSSKFPDDPDDFPYNPLRGNDDDRAREGWFTKNRPGRPERRRLNVVSPRRSSVPASRKHTGAAQRAIGRAPACRGDDGDH
jgi:hypothetical protein